LVKNFFFNQARPLASHSYQIGNGVSTPKRKRSFSDEARERKMQKISLNLANDMARSLSVADHTSIQTEPRRRSSAMNDDTEMFIDEDTIVKDKTDTLAPLSHSRAPLGGIREAESSQPIMRSITELLSSQPLFSNADALQREHWMISQAQNRGMTLSQLEMELRHKEQQLQAAVIALSRNHDIRTDREKEYAHMKDHLEVISKAVEWIEHDQQLPIEVRTSVCSCF
jgi:hypothetical protein